MKTLKHFRIRINYQGTNYSGWQVQPNAPTIQMAIEQVIAKLTGEAIRIHGSGRTDSGVHALGQVAHFKVHTTFDTKGLLKGMNALLPDDIIITDVQQTDPSFHSRYDAIGKHYMYIVHQGQFPFLWSRFYSTLLKNNLSIENIRQAASSFIGTHHFRSFCAVSDNKNEIYDRTIYDFRIDYHPPFIFFNVLGKSFLYKMVRFMVGTLIKIGLGKESPDFINNVFAAPDRYKTGPVAPAKGLTLMNVFYTPPIKLPPPEEFCNFFRLFDVL